MATTNQPAHIKEQPEFSNTTNLTRRVSHSEKAFLCHWSRVRVNSTPGYRGNRFVDGRTANNIQAAILLGTRKPEKL